MSNIYSLPGDPTLPPSVTSRMIDEAAGVYPAQCLRCDDTVDACTLNEDGWCEDCEEAEERLTAASVELCGGCGKLTTGQYHGLPGDPIDPIPCCRKCFFNGKILEAVGDFFVA